MGRIRRWIAKVCGIKGGVTVTVPPGATLIVPDNRTIDTINVVGGTVNLTCAEYTTWRPRAGWSMPMLGDGI